MFSGYHSGFQVQTDGAQLLLERVGRRVRSLRKAARLTLRQLSERSGVSLGYLSQVELAKNSPSIDTLYRVATALSVRVADLFQEGS